MGLDLRAKWTLDEGERVVRPTGGVLAGRTAIVVDHHPLWLDKITQVLAGESIEVVATTTSLGTATGLVEQFEPDLVVVEVAIEEGETSGLSWLAAISERFPALKVIVLSSSDDPASIEAALAGGASVYVVKRAHPADVAVAVRQLYDRSLYIGRGPGVRLQQALQTSEEREDFGLTKRELEILRLTADGLSNGLIAKQLWVTEQTVKFHLSNIYSKLGVSNRTAAGRVAQLNGLLHAPGPGEPPHRRG
jgi:DNA-binding NarL/FixJ family response regulator